MYIERCDIEACTNERPATVTNLDMIPILGQRQHEHVGSEPGWRYVTETVFVKVQPPREILDSMNSGLFGDMLLSAVEDRLSQVPKQVKRLVCPNHDGASWPLTWKRDKDVVQVRLHDGIPRDADGKEIPLE